MHKSKELENLYNSLYTLDCVKNWQITKLFAVYTLIFCVSIETFHGSLIAFTNVDPIVVSLKFVSTDYPTYYFCLRLLLGIYDTWSFALSNTYGAVIFMNGMFLSFIVLSKVVKTTNENIRLCNSAYPKYIEKCIRMYEILLLLAKLINSSFQYLIALPFKFIMITDAIIMGTTLLDNRLRQSLSSVTVFLCIYIVLMTYFCTWCTFSSPGIANTVSKEVLDNLKHKIAMLCESRVVARKDLRRLHRKIRACHEIRIMFGAVNYYEKDTWISIARYMIESTIDFTLMI